MVESSPRPSAPRRLGFVYFEIVHGCQLACVGCPISVLQPKVERVPLARLERCFRNIDIDSVAILSLFGYGEPLLHDDLPGIVEIAATQSWKADRIEISTNGQTVDWAALEEIIRSRRLTSLIVSCDGDGTPEMYEALRPPSRWERLIEFFSKARELRDRHAPDLRLTTRTVVTDWDDRSRWRELLEPLGWESEFKLYVYLIGSQRNMTGRPLEPANGLCWFTEHFNGLIVNIDGSVVPCCIHPKAGLYGNLLEQRFSEIHRGAARAQFVEELRTNRARMEICGQCEIDESVSNVATRAAITPVEAAEAGLIPAMQLTARGRSLHVLQR